MSKRRTTSFYRARLPHWEVQDGVYFVTARLHGALPPHCIRAMEEEALEAARSEGPSKELHQRRAFAILDEYLHNCDGKAHLTEPSVAAALMEAIAHRSADRVWEMHEYVIMPNHVHLLFSLGRSSLRSTMLSFKRWTAGQAKTLLSLTERHFWQNESFDHWIRSQGEFDEISEYIRMNPVMAGLVKDYRDWPYGSWSGKS